MKGCRVRAAQLSQAALERASAARTSAGIGDATHFPGPESLLAAATARRFCAALFSFALAVSIAFFAICSAARSRALRVASWMRSADALASAAWAQLA
jgi:hypothetical protein